MRNRAEERVGQMVPVASICGRGTEKTKDMFENLLHRGDNLSCGSLYFREIENREQSQG